MLTYLKFKISAEERVRLIEHFSQVWPYSSVLDSYIFQMKGEWVTGPSSGVQFHAFCDNTSNFLLRCILTQEGKDEVEVMFSEEDLPEADSHTVETLSGLVHVCGETRLIDSWKFATSKPVFTQSMTLGQVARYMNAYVNTVEDLEENGRFDTYAGAERIPDEAPVLLNPSGIFSPEQLDQVSKDIQEWALETIVM